MLWGDDESNFKQRIAASVGTQLAGWRRGPERLPALVPSLKHHLSCFYLENMLAPTPLMRRHLIPAVCPQQPCNDYRRKAFGEQSSLPCSQASIHLQRILQRSPCRERETLCNPPLVLLLHRHILFRLTQLHTLTYISLSLSCSLSLSVSAPLPLSY